MHGRVAMWTMEGAAGSGIPQLLGGAHGCSERFGARME